MGEHLDADDSGDDDDDANDSDDSDDDNDGNGDAAAAGNTYLPSFCTAYHKLLLSNTAESIVLV